MRLISRAGRRVRGALAAAGLGAAALLAAAPGGASAQGVDKTCEMAFVRFDAATANVLLLDTNSVYWTVSYAAVPGTRLRIAGQFPHARYMSFNVYDTRARPLGGLTDREIVPEPGSTNPFRPKARRDRPARDYEVFVEFREPPRNPRPNTIYTGGGEEPALTGIIWYRVYIPDRGLDRTGGVGVPKVTLEPTAGRGGTKAVQACRDPDNQAPYPQALNELLQRSNGVVPDTGDGVGYPGRNPPVWHKWVNLSLGLTDGFLDNERTEELRDAAYRFPTNSEENNAGIFANRDISYVYTPTSQGHGDLLMIRALAPTFPDTSGGVKRMPAGVQLRYWSFCQYEPLSQRVIDCRADETVAADPRGRYTIVVSTPENRPANARPECGVTWLPWGPAPHGLLIYRHMLAAPSFKHSIQAIPRRGKERETMGDYYPRARYFADKGDFEARGC